MRHAIVLGGNGFLGAHIVDALVSRGYGVTAFDRFSGGYPRYSSSGVRRIQADYRSSDAIARAIDGQSIVVHAVSAITPSRSLGSTKADLVSEIEPMVDVLERSATTNVGRVIFLSSGGAIYGSMDRAAHEADQLLPSSPYGIAKLMAERLLEFYRVDRHLDYTILRVANPYGTYPNGELANFGIIPALLKAAREGEPATQVGDGSMVRDFLHVSEFAEGFSRLLSATPRHRVYNVGSGVPHAVNEVFETVRAVTGCALDARVTPAPPAYVSSIHLDTTRFWDEFGRGDAVSLRAGIAATWAQEAEQ